jgi:hypothetical protein
MMLSMKAWNWIKGRRQRWFCYDIWNVGIVNKDIDEICRMGRLEDVRWAPRQESYEFISDPFVLRYASELTVLVERFDYLRSCKGRISQYRLAPGTAQYQLQDVLDQEHHLSYPYTFRNGNIQYCIPEAYEARRCDLYEIKESGDLEFIRTLIEGVAIVDATVFFENGRWWLFCTHGGSAELYAYHAQTLDDEWRAHAANPIKCDISSSRPAGPPYRRRGNLYRPAQDCSTTYGGAVVISQILELTPDRFQEEVVVRIAPEASGECPDGFHTLNVLDGMCVVDGKRIVTDWSWFLRGWVFGARSRARRRRVGRERAKVASGTVRAATGGLGRSGIRRARCR